MDWTKEQQAEIDKYLKDRTKRLTDKLNDAEKELAKIQNELDTAQQTVKDSAFEQFVKEKNLELDKKQLEELKELSDYDLDKAKKIISIGNFQTKAEEGTLYDDPNTSTQETPLDTNNTTIDKNDPDVIKMMEN